MEGEGALQLVIACLPPHPGFLESWVAGAGEGNGKKKRRKQSFRSLKKAVRRAGHGCVTRLDAARSAIHRRRFAHQENVDDDVKIIVTGTSPLTPKELADGWETAAADSQKLNHVRNNISSNGNLTTIMFLSTRTDPVQKVELDARRAPGEKISRIEILIAATQARGKRASDYRAACLTR